MMPNMIRPSRTLLLSEAASSARAAIDKLSPIDAKATKSFSEEYQDDASLLQPAFTEPLIDVEEVRGKFYIDLLCRPTCLRDARTERPVGALRNSEERYYLKVGAHMHKLERILFALQEGFDPMEDEVVFLDGKKHNLHPANLAFKPATKEGKVDRTSEIFTSFDQTGHLELDPDLLSDRFKLSRKSPSGLSFTKGNFANLKVSGWDSAGWLTCPYVLAEVGDPEDLMATKLTDRERYLRGRPRSVLAQVDRIVWALAEKEDPGKRTIEHKDEDIWNNRVSNLRVTDKPFVRRIPFFRYSSKVGSHRGDYPSVV